MQFTVSVEGLDRLASTSRLLAKVAAEEAAKGLLASALRVEAEAKRSIQGGSKTGRIYKRRAVTHQASAPGEAPASDTGRLVNSINVTMATGKLEATVVAGSGIVNYARHLEFGTERMAERPFLLPALEKSKPFIRERMERALNATIDRAVKIGVSSLRK